MTATILPFRRRDAGPVEVRRLNVDGSAVADDAACAVAELAAIDEVEFQRLVMIARIRNWGMATLAAECVAGRVPGFPRRLLGGERPGAA